MGKKNELKITDLIDFVQGLGGLSLAINDTKDYDDFRKTFPTTEVEKVDYEFVKATINYLVDKKFIQVQKREA